MSVAGAEALGGLGCANAAGWKTCRSLWCSLTGLPWYNLCGHCSSNAWFAGSVLCGEVDGGAAGGTSRTNGSV